MKHYDENIIELYALGSPEIVSIKNDIKRHFSECYSCNEIYLRIKEFYSAVEGAAQIDENRTKSLSTKSLSIKPFFGDNKHPGTLLPKTIIGKTYFLIRTYPVKSGLSLVAAIAIFLLGLNYKSITRDTNPAYLITNDSLKVLQIYNQSNEKLFELPFTLFGSGEHEISYNVKLSCVDDLRQEGKKQIISIVPGLLNSVLYSDTIKVFNYNAQLIKKAKIGRSVKYDGKELADNFNAFSLIVDDFDKDGQKEIYVGAQSLNSPYVLIKLDNNLNVLGEYWHYGHFWGMNKVKVGDKTGILLCGLNDLEKSKEYPVLAFIDPIGLNGIYQSENTPVFNDLKLYREIYYKKIPRSSISDSIRQKPRMHCLISLGNNELKVSYGLAGLSNSSNYGKLILTLNNNFDIVNVIGDDTFNRIWGNDNYIKKQISKNNPPPSVKP